MEDLNGNGNGWRVPPARGNARGYRHGVDGEECRPCRDDDGKSPYIGRKGGDDADAGVGVGVGLEGRRAGGRERGGGERKERICVSNA